MTQEKQVPPHSVSLFSPGAKFIFDFFQKRLAFSEILWYSVKAV
jgi:hypothetical protein